MRLVFIAGIIANFAFSGVAFGGASCGVCPLQKASVTEAKQYAAAETAVQDDKATVTEVGNAFCPVSGEKIPEGKAVKIEYNGKVYNLCCGMCEKDFRKDPEKYIKIIKTQKSEEHSSHQH